MICTVKHESDKNDKAQHKLQHTHTKLHKMVKGSPKSRVIQ